MAQGTFAGPAARVIRERSEMTMRELVAKIGEQGIDVHEDHLRNIELGYKQPSPKLAGAIAHALAVPKHVLLLPPPAPPSRVTRKGAASKSAAA